MRKVVYDALKAGNTVVGAGLLFEASSIEGAPNEKPFAVMRYGPIATGMGSAVVRTMSLWVHDERGSYTRIETALRRARVIMDGLQNIQTERGWLMSCEWIGDSGDLLDDVFRTNVRYSEWRLVGTGE